MAFNVCIKEGRLEFDKGVDRMKVRKTLRQISLVMLILAVVFVFCALSNPALGRTIYVGDLVFGAKQWRFCYKVYAIVMVGLFVTSFFVKEKSK